MKKIVYFLFLCISPSLFANSWFTDFENAKKVAITTNKLIIVDFWATWCGPCKKMDREVWSDPEVQEKMEAFVPLKIDLDVKRELALKFKVKAIPYVFIIDGNGEIVFQSLGYIDKNKTLEILNSYALNTSFLQAESIHFYKNQNYASALRLSKKYLDYSLFVNPELSNDILNVSESYLKQADRLIERDQSNRKMVLQKIELLEANIDLYKGNYRKLNKFLEKKIDMEDLKKTNWAIYSFLNYCSAMHEKNKNTATKWKKELNNSRGGDHYLTLAEKFLALDES